MTHAKDDSAISLALEQIIENGFEGLDTALSILINEAMRVLGSFEVYPWHRRKVKGVRFTNISDRGLNSAAWNGAYKEVIV